MNQQNIIEIKKKLSELKTQKEAFFKAQQDKKKAVFAHITQIKELRSSYNSSSVFLKELLRKRDDYNKKVKEAIQNIKNIESKRKDLLKNSKIRFDPSIKYQIESLEEKIETQGIDFEKEKKIMKKINELKKKYLQFSQLNDVIGEQRKIQTQIDQNKTQANQIHNQIRELQRKNKQLKKEFIKNSKEIMNLKKEQSESFQKFLDSKKEFVKLNGYLREDKIKNQKQRKHVQDQIIRKKQEQLEQKIKNKQKITTEDLLVFQSR